MNKDLTDFTAQIDEQFDIGDFIEAPEDESLIEYLLQFLN